MAEAIVVERQPIDRFYCHSCTKEITPDLPDFTCPQCDDGFVEQISSEEESAPQSPEDNAGIPVPVHAVLQNIMEQFLSPSLGNFVDSERGSTITINPPSMVTRSRRQQQQQQQQQQHQESFRLGNLMHLIAQDRFGGGGMFHLHGSPGDYAWGAHGFDSIISQLLNQLEGSGAPPAPEDKIDNLPKVIINQEQVEKNIQCSVCFDDYSLGEEVIKLPCEHLYHPQCIIPWLKLHGTCPICRKDLNGENVENKESDMPPDSSY